MTTKKPENPPPETDPKQSERFRKAVRDLEAAGELSPADGERALDGVLKPSCVPMPSSGPKPSP